jgi:hypothetical protein
MTHASRDGKISGVKEIQGIAGSLIIIVIVASLLLWHIYSSGWLAWGAAVDVLRRGEEGRGTCRC